MTTIKPTYQILDEAADLLAEEGRWTQGEWHAPCRIDDNGVSHCADGAIEVASGLVSNFRFEDDRLRWDISDDPEVEAAYQAAYDTASIFVRGDRHPGRGILHFNDEVGRTQEEVVAALRGAAYHARGEHLVGNVVARADQLT